MQECHALVLPLRDSTIFEGRAPSSHASWDCEETDCLHISVSPFYVMPRRFCHVFWDKYCAIRIIRCTPHDYFDDLHPRESIMETPTRDKRYRDASYDLAMACCHRLPLGLVAQAAVRSNQLLLSYHSRRLVGIGSSQPSGPMTPPLPPSRRPPLASWQLTQVLPQPGYQLPSI